MDQLTIPRYLAMARYWRAHPPVHLMVAGYLGIKTDSDDGVWDEMALTPQDLLEMRRGGT